MATMKKKTTNKVYKTIDKIKLKLGKIVKELITKTIIMSLCIFFCLKSDYYKCLN
ncbi:hypothetical protein FPN187_contig00010-0018 [Flavobacterium psychrophilum]|nr:hypothetical protein FPN181_contig00009-0047 [Flavobacterium psychrophilum]GEJ32591.1 hypothetical protein FPN187_contig00010-0018 [Flavobacterium psychrophilum]GEJ36435.1 hypothetical protein FPN182_contig00010-0047 [Flavobacterium psychrophilum]GEJ36850.1 hypothetical protein FPN186_contig00007-0018 [Flavobacterium psychrophilum]GEJ51282.1 hypothetical protein FPKKO176_contig00027-0002 [Flavobacterium psychrophilum]